MMQPEHEYKNVPHSDDHRDDDSSTEVESLVGMEKQWAAENFATRTRRSKRSVCLSLLKASRWFVVIGLQVIIVGLLAKEQGLLMDGWWSSQGSSSAKEVGGDITGWGPHSMSCRPCDKSHTHQEQSQLRSKRSKSTRPSRRTTRPSSSSPKSFVHGTN
jgi:hypothetical protein